MTRDEETYFLRLMQAADAATLAEHFTLVETRSEKEDGALIRRYDVTWGHDTGYLIIKTAPDSGALMAAEMDVNFPTMLGLNRSPLELRILAEHMLATFDPAK